MEMRPLRWDRAKTEGSLWIFSTSPCVLRMPPCVCMSVMWTHLNIHCFQRTVRCVKRAKHPWRERRECETTRERERKREIHVLSQPQSQTSKHCIKLTEAIKINNNERNGEEQEAGKWSGGKERCSEIERGEETEMRKSVCAGPCVAFRASSVRLRGSLSSIF